jgi:hypothetical protein
VFDGLVFQDEDDVALQFVKDGNTRFHQETYVLDVLCNYGCEYFALWQGVSITFEPKKRDNNDLLDMVAGYCPDFVHKLNLMHKFKMKSVDKGTYKVKFSGIKNNPRDNVSEAHFEWNGQSVIVRSIQYNNTTKIMKVNYTELINRSIEGHISFRDSTVARDFRKVCKVIGRTLSKQKTDNHNSNPLWQAHQDDISAH